MCIYEIENYKDNSFECVSVRGLMVVPASVEVNIHVCLYICM